MGACRVSHTYENDPEIHHGHDSIQYFHIRQIMFVFCGKNEIQAVKRDFGSILSHVVGVGANDLDHEGDVRAACS
jgi:hypothetical protein